ncbi:MAG: type VI secretion system tip protein VgrG [Ginsengibacter sp.]
MPDLLSSIPPGSEPATDIVNVKIFVNGDALSKEALLMQVTVIKSFNKISSAKIIFLDGSASERDFMLSNDDKFKPGNTLKIQLGYHDDADTIFEGIIIKHSIKIRQQAPSLLMIEAKDKAVKLTIARKSIYHINKTDSEVITDLADDLNKEIDPTTFTHKQLVQFDATDWDFILTRAEANGMFVLTDDNKLIVKKPATNGSPVLTATYGDNIFEFEAEMDARKQVKQITSYSWDYTSQEIEESDPGDASLSENGNISSDDLGTVLNAEIKLNHSGNLTEAQLQDWSDAYAMRKHLLKIAGRVRIQGKASVKPGSIIALAGVGDRFNGNVFATGVLHHYEGNWKTDIQFGWNDDWFYKKEDVMNKPAGGLLPGINGLQIGVVLDVDDTEDGGQFRIKVHVPIITSGNEGIWARVATLDAGDNRGVYFRPQTGDEVVLGFLNDDPREAIVLGYLHSNDSKPSPLPEEDGLLQYGFVTKEGMKLIFDDTNKRISVVATTAAGEKSIIMNDDSGAFIMEDENGNTIKMDMSGITIQSSKNVTIKGSQVMIN